MPRPAGVRSFHAKWIAKRAEVCELRRQGMSYRSIAHTKKCSISFIQDALRRKAETHSHADRPRPGGPRKVTEAVVRKTSKLLRNRNVGSVRKVRLELRAAGVDLSRGTVHNIARRSNLRSAVPIPKPKLTDAHRAARLAWARLHEGDTELTIRSRVFADEKSFRVTDVSHRVWLRPIDPTPIRETRKRSEATTHVDIIFAHTPQPSCIVCCCDSVDSYRSLCCSTCTQFVGSPNGCFLNLQKNSQRRLRCQRSSPTMALPPSSSFQRTPHSPARAISIF